MFSIRRCPASERSIYLQWKQGDLAVSALTSYLSHNVPEATSNVLADLAEHQDPTTGFIPPASMCVRA
jgi:hypothetical protein